MNPSSDGHRDRPQIFGSVFYFDLLRTARRPRFFVLRGLYAAGLCALLTWMYLIWTSKHSRLYPSGIIPINEFTQFAETFFQVFMLLQFAVVLLMTPIYCASTISEEKERKTLEYLLATDLRSSEIVLGKLAARVGSLLVFVLGGCRF